MLEHFDIDESEKTFIQADELQQAVIGLFLSREMPADQAATAADVLVSADKRGVDTHGVSNMLRRYLQLIDDGFINPRPDWQIVRESPASASIDCDRGLGIVVLPKAMEIAIDKAKHGGTATVLAGNGRHAGMLAYHSMLALKHDMIGYALTAGGKVMVPTFGGEPMLGTNPHSWAVPAGELPSFVLDASSTVVAANKIDLLRRNKTQMLPGWAADADGSPITESRVPPDFTWLLPLGSTRENGSQKGYGLGALAQLLTGVLYNGEFGDYGKGRMSHMVSATDIKAFSDVGLFKSRVDSFLKYLMSTKPEPRADRVVYPGLLEHEESVRRVDGIPLHREVVDWINASLRSKKLDVISSN